MLGDASEDSDADDVGVADAVPDGDDDGVIDDEGVVEGDAVLECVPYSPLKLEPNTRRSQPPLPFSPVARPHLRGRAGKG